MPQPRMVVCISRPGTRLSHGREARRTSARESRVRNRISPIQMNSGSAASSHDALRSQNAENRFLPGCVAGEEGLADPADDRERHRDPDAAGEQHQHQRRAAARRCRGCPWRHQMSSEKSPRACRSSTATHVASAVPPRSTMTSSSTHRDEEQDRAEREASSCGIQIGIAIMPLRHVVERQLS